MRIPVFHDDQHGTAIVVAAAILNGLKIVGKAIDDVKLVCSGAGAAALACLNLLCVLGLEAAERLDRGYQGRGLRGPHRADGPLQAALRARDVQAHAGRDHGRRRHFPRACRRAASCSKEMVASMAERPLVFALANPTPEILPEDVKAVRPDAIIASGRTDYPNQINNVLCFPVHFPRRARCGRDHDQRGHEEGGRRRRWRAWPRAKRPTSCSRPITPRRSCSARTTFCPSRSIRVSSSRSRRPSPRRRWTSGVATRPIADFDAYRQKLTGFVFRSGFMMRPYFEARPERIERDAQAARVRRRRPSLCSAGVAAARLRAPCASGAGGAARRYHTHAPASGPENASRKRTSTSSIRRRTPGCRCWRMSIIAWSSAWACRRRMRAA